MALKFHKLKVIDVKPETADAVSITLEVPQDLKETFQYKPGQYLTVQVVLDGQKFRRAYSLSSSPVIDPHLTITTKRVDKGLVSNYLNDHIKKGDELEVMPPLGNFVPKLDPNNEKNYVFFSGGSGITPIMSIMKTVLKAEPKSSVTLFYGNRNAESIIFHKELMKLKDEYGERINMVHTLDQYSDDWEGYQGRMDKEKANYLLDNYCKSTWEKSEYYICGPAPMMNEVELALQNKLIPKEQIHKEHFTSNLLETDAADKIKEATAAGTESEDEGELSFPVKAKIILDGNEYEVEIGEKDTVLEAAIDADVDPPFACQIGACSTCRAKLREGKVEMDEREALTDEEIAEGYILTCQSHPKTNKLVVDYDG